MRVSDKYNFCLTENPSYNTVNAKLKELTDLGWTDLEFVEKGETNCSDPRSDYSWGNHIRGLRPMTKKEINDCNKKRMQEGDKKLKDLLRSEKLAEKWGYKLVKKS